METFFALGDLKPQGANRCLTSKTGEFYLKQVTESLKLKKRLKHSKLVYLILGLTFYFDEIIGRTFFIGFFTQSVLDGWGVGVLQVDALKKSVKINF